jgi:N-acetylglucosamine kinase-like BadF-type ATPase
VAGAGDASAREIIDSIADQLFDRSVTAVSISHDLKIAHAGGLGGQAGIALVAGTGSACYGVNSRGDEILTGGWGDLIDDAGGGAWIGLRALQMCVRQADGRVAGKDLQDAVLRFLELDSIDQFKKRIHLIGLNRSERAKLAPAVFELAESGDAAAGQLVREAVHELTILARCNQKALGFTRSQLVVLGGLNESNFFRERLQASIQATMPGVAASKPRLGATAGGIILAMRAVGVDANEAVLDQMRCAIR